LRPGRTKLIWTEASLPDQTTLAPGKSVSYQCNLGSFFDIGSPGVYAVEVSYSWDTDGYGESAGVIATTPARFRITGPGSFGPPIEIAVNGRDIAMSSSPIIVRNRMIVTPELVPAMGASLKMAKEITVSRGSKEVSFRLNHPVARTNSQEKPLDVAPMAIRGRILLPMRAMVEGIGGRIFWNVAERKAWVVIRPDRSIAKSRSRRLPTFFSGIIKRERLSQNIRL